MIQRILSGNPQFSVTGCFLLVASELFRAPIGYRTGQVLTPPYHKIFTRRPRQLRAGAGLFLGRTPLPRPPAGCPCRHPGRTPCPERAEPEMWLHDKNLVRLCFLLREFCRPVVPYASLHSRHHSQKVSYWFGLFCLK